MTRYLYWCLQVAWPDMRGSGVAVLFKEGLGMKFICSTVDNVFTHSVHRMFSETVCYIVHLLLDRKTQR